MQTEARVGVVVEGGGAQRALHAGHGGGVAAVAQSLPQPQPKSLQQSQIGTLSQLLAGGVAGALAKTCTAPLARLTILFQIQGMHSDVATMRKASIWREASRIAGEEGFRAFWKGNLVTIAHRLPYSSVNFYSYEQYKKILHTVPGLENSRDNMSTDICVHFVGGGLAGITAATATYPLDLVRTRLAAQGEHSCNVTWALSSFNLPYDICRPDNPSFPHQDIRFSVDCQNVKDNFRIPEAFPQQKMMSIPLMTNT